MKQSGKVDLHVGEHQMPRCCGLVYPGTPQFYTAFSNLSSSSLALPQVQGQTWDGGVGRGEEPRAC